VLITGASSAWAPRCLGAKVKMEAVDRPDSPVAATGSPEVLADCQTFADSTMWVADSRRRHPPLRSAGARQGAEALGGIDVLVNTRQYPSAARNGSGALRGLDRHAGETSSPRMPFTPGCPAKMSIARCEMIVNVSIVGGHAGDAIHEAAYCAEVRPVRVERIDGRRPALPGISVK